MSNKVVKEIIVGRGIKKRIKKGKEDRHFNRSSQWDEKTGEKGRKKRTDKERKHKKRKDFLKLNKSFHEKYQNLKEEAYLLEDD